MYSSFTKRVTASVAHTVKTHFSLLTVCHGATASEGTQEGLEWTRDFSRKETTELLRSIRPGQNKYRNASAMLARQPLWAYRDRYLTMRRDTVTTFNYFITKPSDPS
jgi:hypothetical protein